MNPLKHLLLLPFFLLNSILFSQTITIEGTVSTCGNKQETLPYAHIQIEGTGYGTISDLEGKFNLKAPAFLIDSMLAISFVGYESAHIPVASFQNNPQEVHLKEAVNEISEIVVKPPNPVHVLANVLHHLDTNFWQSPFNAEAVYLEFIVIGNEIGRISEADCELFTEKFRDDYSKEEASNYSTQTRKFKDFDANLSIGAGVYASPLKQVKINQLTHYYNPTPSDIKLSFRGGPIGAFSEDAFASKSFSLRPEKDFEKTCEKISWASKASVRYDVWNGRPVYRLKTSSFTFIIDKETYALIGYDRVIHFSGKLQKIVRLNKRFKKGDSRKDQISWDSIQISVRYMPVGKQWYPFSTVAEHYYTYIPYKKESIQLVGNRELKYSSVTAKNATNFDPRDCFNFYSNNSITDLPESQATKRTLSNEILYINTLDPTFRKKLLSYSVETNSIVAEDYSLMAPPVALRIADTLKINDEYFVDYYSWLEETEDDRVMDYIAQENKYADWYFKQYDTIVNNISRELERKYIRFSKRNDTIFRGDNYIYFIRENIEENEYGGIIRIKKIDTTLSDTVLKFKPFFEEYPNGDLGKYMVNNAETIFAYTQWPDGYSNWMDFKTVFRDIKKDSIIDEIVSDDYTFLNDTTVLYLTRTDPKDGRNTIAYSKVLGKKQSKKLYETNLYLGIKESDSKRYTFIYDGDPDEGGILYFDREIPEKGLRVFVDEDSTKKKMSFNHFKNFQGFIYTKFEDGKYKLYRSSENGSPSKNDSLLLSSEHRLIIEYATQNTIFLTFEQGFKIGLLQYSLKTGKAIEIPFSDSVYKITFLGADDNNTLSLKFSTFDEPSKYYELAENVTMPTLIASDSLENYNKNDYAHRILEVKARDGKMIPIVILYKKGNPLQSIPVYMEFYTGNAFSPHLYSNYFPLLDRGVAVVFPMNRETHKVRQQLEEQGWYEHTGAEDVADVVKYLIENNITDTSMISLSARSYGGFLLSYIVNNYPDLMACAIINVPVTNMLWTLADSTDTETVSGYSDYGSPYIKKELEVIKSYDPYLNIKPHDYPPMLFYAGLRDINVNPVDAIRSVAKIRHADSSNKDILLRVLMNSDHLASEGKQNTQLAWNIAFALAHIKYKNDSENDKK